MSIIDKIRSMLGEHSTKAEELANQGIDKAAQMAKEKTGGQYDQYIDAAAEQARQRADMIDGQTGTSPVPGETATPRSPGEAGTSQTLGETEPETGPSSQASGATPTPQESQTPRSSEETDRPPYAG
ncbi:antitoxin [Streptosporangium roseum]|uniref:antitoxin n=1 Tax=Streptosporangium roseum TaxID=2001 RepID=UPI00332913E7